MLHFRYKHSWQTAWDGNKHLAEVYLVGAMLGRLFDWEIFYRFYFLEKKYGEDMRSPAEKPVAVYSQYDHAWKVYDLNWQVKRESFDPFNSISDTLVLLRKICEEGGKRCLHTFGYLMPEEEIVLDGGEVSIVYKMALLGSRPDPQLVCRSLYEIIREEVLSASRQ